MMPQTRWQQIVTLALVVLIIGAGGVIARKWLVRGWQRG